MSVMAAPMSPTQAKVNVIFVALTANATAKSDEYLLRTNFPAQCHCWPGGSGSYTYS